MTPAAAWRLWQCAAAPGARAFDRALKNPREARARHLRRILQHAAGSDFAETYGVHPGLDPGTYARRVPVMDAAAQADWTARLLKGEKNPLFRQRVDRLVPTSGSTGPVKLVPMCVAGRRESARTVNLWVADMLRTAPGIRRGCAYIATSPALDSPYPDATIPVGYAEDEAYLGPLERRVLNRLLAVPTSVARLRGEEWRDSVREGLLAARDLRLLSLWHPAYLEALFEPDEFARLPEAWPNLDVISCWADGVCREEAERLWGLFPRATLQPKGLWLTEGMITVPWRGRHPLALFAGYVEFENEAGEVVPFQALRTGGCYRLLLSNHAGLYRCRLGDVVELVDWLHATPCFRWVGRADAVSDMCGEKLSEAQMECALREAGIGGGARLRPDRETRPPVYRLRTLDSDPDLEALECALRRNPHYLWARELGQLGAVLHD